jgi:hypothetical protein
MCIAVFLALIVLPLCGGAFGYARYGAVGGWVGALGGLAAALVLVGGPFALLANNERRKLAQERRDHPENRLDD